MGSGGSGFIRVPFHFVWGGNGGGLQRLRCLRLGVEIFAPFGGFLRVEIFAPFGGFLQEEAQIPRASPELAQGLWGASKGIAHCLSGPKP